MGFLFSEGRSLFFSMLTFSSIIYYRQKCYDEIASRTVWNMQYDYIVIGGGSAGATVAGRLSEESGITVLLLEAGTSETVVSNTPALAETLQGTVLDWRFASLPQDTSCFALKNQESIIHGGRTLGGTSAINNMIYLRGNPNDFDNWERLGANGWSWKSVFPYFIRSENQTDKDLAKSGFHGVNGPLPVSNLQDHNPILKKWMSASKSTGYRQRDLNGPTQSGTTIPQTTTRKGKRISTATAFLEPNKKRENLHILGDAFVTKILFDDQKRAIGVNFIKNWKKYNVYAKYEIILSAGTINSAVILMLSGIGPKYHLRDLRIPVIADLPVGENFHDQVGTLGLHFTMNTSLPEPLTLNSLTQYFNTGEGPLSEAQHATTMAQSDYVDPELDWPDIVLDMSLSSPGRDGNGKNSEQRYGIRTEFWDQFYKPHSGISQFTVFPVLLRPKSRGWVRLKSENPLESPLINPNYFSHHEDMKILVIAMKEAYRIALSPSMQRLGAKPFDMLVPGCEHYAHDEHIQNNNNNNNIQMYEFNELIINKTVLHAILSDAYLECVARTFTLSGGNYVGTCRMGADNDTAAIVDSRLKVRGVNGLRVIDASVMPQVPAAFINAATIMIGERGVQFIREDYDSHITNRSNSTDI